MNTKILGSLLLVAAVFGAVALGTGAFFTDTETSEGNVFQAGAIDLKIDNSSWYNGEYREDLSWEYSDLTDELFFNYKDVKPGDWGEDTISIHVYDNDAYLCADITLTENEENDVTEPEEELGDTEETGELAQELNFILWADDGDNVLEFEEEETVVWATLGDAWLNQTHTFSLADSRFNAWNDGQEGGPITGSEDYYIGKFWCFGNIELDPVDVGEDPSVATGAICDGKYVTNISQTDSAKLNVGFVAVQSRNNEEFVCESEFLGRTRFLRLENKTEQYEPILGDGTRGTLSFISPYPTFKFDLEVYGLQPTTDYYLHYYKDPWPGTGGLVLHSFTTDGSGNWMGSGEIELDTDLPVVGDANWPDAKIWVIPQSHWDGTQMTAWDQTQYLWEWNLVQYDDSDL